MFANAKIDKNNSVIVKTGHNWNEKHTVFTRRIRIPLNLREVQVESDTY